MEIITETLHKLGIDEYQRTHKSSDGELLFQLIRRRVPESIALNDMRTNTLTWDALMRKLQEAYNMNQADDATGENVKLMTPRSTNNTQPIQLM